MTFFFICLPTLVVPKVIHQFPPSFTLMCFIGQKLGNVYCCPLCSCYYGKVNSTPSLENSADLYILTSKNMGSDILLLPIALEQSHNKIQDIYGKHFN